MPELKRGHKLLLLHAVALPALLFAYAAFSRSGAWQGVDDAVVEKIAAEHGRFPHAPLIDPGSGDLLLFVFLVAGTIAGFAAGYYWRILFRRKDD
jgi:ABC-type cobalt transport system substrate-binding protein